MAVKYDKGSKNVGDIGNPSSNKSKRTVLILMALFVIIGASFCIWKVNNKQDNSILHEDSNVYSKSIVDSDPSIIPDYNGDSYVNLNDGIPNFTKYDLKNIKGESYSDLDELGRCGTAVAMIDKSMIPTEKRGSIGRIKPSGWVQKQYPGIVTPNPPYLYSRCHLIAHGLTGQNDNELNLITGTRHFNVEAMLPFEIQAMDYIKEYGNHVLYRVSPYFANDELLARGVEMEAYSVEDDGDGVCFHVFVYNIQPGVKLNYKTGESEAESEQNVQLSCYELKKWLCRTVIRSKDIRQFLHKRAA